MLSVKPVANFTMPKIGFGFGSPFRASSNPSPNLDLSGRSGNKANSASAALFGDGDSNNRPDPLLDLDRLPLPLPPGTFEGRCIVRIERNRHHSPLARAFLPYYLFDDAGRQYLVITGNRQLCEAAQFQFQLPIVSPSPSFRALAPNIFTVATTDGLPAGRLHLFGNKLVLLASEEQEQEQEVESGRGENEQEQEQAKEKKRVSKGSGRVGRFSTKPVPVVLRFVEVKEVAQPQPQSNP
jgi:hypothetical protein